jgi:hypothetical protein
MALSSLFHVHAFASNRYLRSSIAGDDRGARQRRPTHRAFWEIVKSDAGHIAAVRLRDEPDRA